VAKPNPLILVMGTAPLAQVAGMVWASKAPYAARVAGTAGCVVLAIACVTFAVFAFLHGKKKERDEAARKLERKRAKSKGEERRLRDASAAPTGSGARPASAADRPSRDGS
jgi:cbb3-type cytochrome oxidase subunit 3